MADADRMTMGPARRPETWVRLRTLVLLRWMAILGQSVVVLISDRAFGLHLPIGLSFAVISVSLWFNIIATLVAPANKRLTERGALLSMLFDLSQLSALLALTGGLTNPFSLLILAPVTISASILTLRSTLILGVTAIASVSLLRFFHMPLTFGTGEVLSPPELYLNGAWTSVVIGVVFLSGYARRVATETLNMSLALGATQMALERERRLADIGGLAAAAAHELGSPLATIKLVSGELARDLADRPDLAEDLALIREQAERCRLILSDLSKGGRDDEHVKTAPLLTVIEEAAGPYLATGKRLILRLNRVEASALDAAERATQPLVRRDPEIVHGLRNLIQNALEFAASTVWIDAEISDSGVRVSIGDDGPGFPPDLIDRLGEPYVTTRPPAGRRDVDGAYEGMGLGAFIARTLLARTGARITFANGSDRGGRLGARLGRGAAPDPGLDPALARPSGAIVHILWPGDSLVASRKETRGPLGVNLRFT